MAKTFFQFKRAIIEYSADEIPIFAIDEISEGTGEYHGSFYGRLVTDAMTQDEARTWLRKCAEELEGGGDIITVIDDI